jgi:hypothetical protein
MLFVVVGLLLPAAANAGPPMMDPKQVSGIPRVDASVAPGSVTVRCLLGGFDEPAPAGVVVTLALTSADGTKKEERQAPVAEAGRATFEGLDEFVGGQAVASVELDGEAVGSQPIPLDARAGSRVLLVKGAANPNPTAGAGGHGTGQGGAHGGLDVPLPGQPFELVERPAGTIIAGTLDLEHGVGPIGGIEVTLTARTPDLKEGEEPIVRKLTTNEEGRAVFGDLVPPEFPAGTKFQLEAVLDPGEPPKQSVEFEFGEHAIAVVLARGFDSAAAAAPTPRPSRRPTMPPRADSRVPAGSVRVAVIGADDQPVPDVSVQVVKKDMAGTDTTFEAQTDASGVALVDGISVASDAFYFAGVIYDGAPYQSAFFQLPENTGASVELRVFPTTSDPTRVRGGLHFEVRPLENDAVQVIRVFEVFIDGDEAYWPAGGMHIYGAPGSRFVKVLPRSARFLEEREGAPYAALTGPIPPGEVVELSIAYVVDHDGQVELAWKAPFPLVQAAVALEPGLELLEGGQGPPESPPHQSGSDVRLWTIQPPPFVEGPCTIAARQDPSFKCPDLLSSMGGTRVEFVVGGLPTRTKVFRHVALGLAGIVIVFVGAAMALRPRASRRDALIARRDLLQGELAKLPDDAPASQRDRIAAALDRVYRGLDALGERADAGEKDSSK